MHRNSVLLALPLTALLFASAIPAAIPSANAQSATAVVTPVISMTMVRDLTDQIPVAAREELLQPQAEKKTPSGKSSEQSRPRAKTGT